MTDRCEKCGLSKQQLLIHHNETVAVGRDLVRRAAPFVNACVVMAEDKAPGLAWMADAADYAGALQQGEELTPRQKATIYRDGMEVEKEAKLEAEAERDVYREALERIAHGGSACVFARQIASVALSGGHDD